jgi:hypothetical protein
VAELTNGTVYVLNRYSHDIYGDWASHPDSTYQNACIAIGLPMGLMDRLRNSLAELARNYRQDSIALAIAITEFVKGASDD